MAIYHCNVCDERTHSNGLLNSLPTCSTTKCKKKNTKMTLESATDPVTNNQTLTYRNNTYAQVRLVNTVFWVRLDVAGLGLTGQNTEINVYTTAMMNGFIGNKSIGYSGIKKEPDERYYVKVDYNTANNNSMDNTLSPRADLWQVGQWRLLNFDVLAKRHW